MEELAHSLLGTLKRSSAPVETKLSLLNSLKSSIKHQRIPDSAQSATIECIRIAITTQTSSTLVIAGFATLTHLIKRLTIQEEIDALFSQRANLLPLLLEKLGDVKDAHRQAASQALCDLWLLKPAEIEKIIREGAIQGNNVRAKEAGMEWVTKMHTQHAMQFRNFVSLLVECLEDAEGSVRDCAKINILALFGDARDAAKADLKRQLLAFNVRRSITTFILAQLQVPGYTEGSSTAPNNTGARHEVQPQDPAMDDTSQSESAKPSTNDTPLVEPLYIQSQRELEDCFAQMPPCFEGREGDDNWKPRDMNTTKLRRLLRGNAPTDYRHAFMAGIKGLLDGILKVVNSLRTTMCTNGSLLVQELAKTLGSAMDPLVDMILQGLQSMSAATKHISGQNAYVTIDTIFANVSFHMRLVQHIWQAAQDKNAQPRIFASGWLKTILKKQIHNKAQFEHSGALELADKAIRKCLADANPKSRENMRGTFWFFAQTWPERGEAIMATLDAKSRQLLEKDSANPHLAQHASTTFTTSVGPAAAPNPRAASSTGRSSLKDTIAAQKRAALAAKRLPERPNSAMSSFSPVKQPPPSVHRNAPTPAASRERLTASNEVAAAPRPPLTSFNTVSGSGLLSSAPMRRPRRPEMPRPATADIYTNRRMVRAETPSRSPVTSPSRTSALSNMTTMGVAMTAGATTRTRHEPNITTTNSRVSPGRHVMRTPRSTDAMLDTSARQPPAATRINPTSPSHTSNAEQFTIVIPQSAATSARQVLSPRAMNGFSRSAQPRLSLPTMNEEDNFTLIMPQMSQLSNLGSPKVLQAHPKSLTDAHSSTLTLTQQDQISAIDFANTSVYQSLSLQSPQDDPLIIFEDPKMENIVIPLTSIDSTRSALEELQLNSQQLQTQMNAMTITLPIEIATASDRPASPTKKVSATGEVSVNSPIMLEAEQLLQRSIEILRERTIDPQDFKYLLVTIKQQGAQSAPFLEDILSALLSFLQSLSTRADLNLRTQAVTCLRSVVAVFDTSKNTNICPDILPEILLESQYHQRYSLAGNELDAIVHDITTRLDAPTSSACLDQLASHNWSQYSSDRTSYSRIMPTVLRALGRIAGNMPSALTADQRKQLLSLALRSLCDLDVDVRRAATEFCVMLYTVFGSEHEAELWKALRGAGVNAEGKSGEAQVNLVAYYLAKSGKGRTPPTTVLDMVV